jgi:SAM-dependent methyltransferase
MTSRTASSQTGALPSVIRRARQRTFARHRPGGPAFDAFLLREEEAAFPWEHLDRREATQRRLKPPFTYLASGTRRFGLLAEHLAPLVAAGASVCDVGAYPGTSLRLMRALPGAGETRLAAAGLGFDPPFRAAMEKHRVELIEAEFDVRACPPGGHLLETPLADPAGDWDVVVCSEVIEHQQQPLSLLCGVSRMLRPGGTLLMTTNSASFIGDILKLAAGRHNVEALHRSHVLLDSEWRPHIRLYFREELEQLLDMAGLRVTESFYFDGGNVYRGVKGAAVASVRALAGVLPRYRSHVFLRATVQSAPTAQTLQRLRESFHQYGLPFPYAPSDGRT